MRTEDSARPVGISAQIPLRPFPYYADAMTELAFVLPTLRPSAGDSSASLRSVESSDSGQDVSFSLPPTNQASAVPTPQQLVPPTTPQSHTSRQMSQPPPTTTPTSAVAPPTDHPPSPSPASGTHKNDYMNIDAFPSSKKEVTVGESSVVAEGYTTYPGPSSRTKKTSRITESFLAPTGGGGETPRRRGVVPQDGAAIVVWLEKFEDHTHFPAEVLSRLLHGASLTPGLGGSHKFSTNAKKSLPIIFIHRMASGLYQIATHSTEGK